MLDSLYQPWCYRCLILNSTPTKTILSLAVVLNISSSGHCVEMLCLLKKVYCVFSNNSLNMRKCKSLYDKEKKKNHDKKHMIFFFSVRLIYFTSVVKQFLNLRFIMLDDGFLGSLQVFRQCSGM